MNTHINFNTLSSSPGDHEAPEGHCALLLNLIAEEDTLKPLAFDHEAATETPAGSRLRATHRHDGFTHLITETPHADGTCDYHWHTPGGGPSGLIATTTGSANALTAIGGTLCLIMDDGLLLATWQQQQEAYFTITRDDLLYDITLTQDQQTSMRATIPLEGSTANYLDQAGKALTTRPTLPQHVLAEWPISEQYATGATMLAALLESDLDRQLSLMGPGAMKHVCLGVAALRLSGGRHAMVSNPFALLPAGLPTTIVADHEAGQLTMEAWGHRHNITVTMRSTRAMDAGIVEGVDIFLTRPLRLLHPCHADIDTDQQGRTTCLTFAQLDRKDIIHLLDTLTFHHAMTIGREDMGQPTLVRRAAEESTPLSLADLHRTAHGARHAIAHNNRLTLAATTTLLHSPMEIGLRYRYHTLDADTRRAMDDEEAAEARATEMIAGSRADIGDNSDGATATLVIRGLTTGAHPGEVWWAGEVQYPLPGMMAFPGAHIKELEYHLRLEEDGQQRHYTTRQPLETLESKGMAVAVFTAGGQAHRSGRPALHSLLLQQVRTLAYDDATDCYDTNYMLWEEESAEEFERHYEKARKHWALPCDTNSLLTSEEGAPLLTDQATATHIGQGTIQGLVPSMRRSADGLYGDGQFHAFTDSGVWLLRFSNARWHAHQAVTRTAMRQPGQMAVTNDAVVFISPRGLMLLRGATCSCLSDDLNGMPFQPDALPHQKEMLATEPTLALPEHIDPWTGSFMDHARLAYDSANDRLWLIGSDPATPMLVYSLQSKAWGMATPPGRITDDGTDLWCQQQVEGREVVTRLHTKGRGRQAVALVTRPLALGLRHVPKTVESMLVRGLFCHRGPKGSHVGVALYGSHDLRHWHLIGSSRQQFITNRRGSPFPWFRILAVGALAAGESIEGASFTFQKRMKKE